MSRVCAARGGHPRAVRPRVRFSRGRPPHGAALLLVLWLLVLLTGLLGTFALTARTEGLQGRQLRDSTAAHYAAQAGIELAVVRLLDADPATRWIPDGREYVLDVAAARLRIRIVDESGKVDLNAADVQLLGGLFLALQVDAARAQALAGAIIDWRDGDELLQINGAEDPQYADAGLDYGAKDRRFDAVTELQQVLGMDYALYRRVADLVTVDSGRPRPDPAFAPALVLTALGSDPAQAALSVTQRQAWQPQSGQPAPLLPDGVALTAAPGSGTYSIHSQATTANRSMAELFVTVRAGAIGAYGQLYAPLRWREGAPL